ncbi:hypothetical protein EDEG_03804 [Edhazardia aedis USNM 41457]|uniref:Uncharacterized protein n=1 Tax=Edhazardia aedis (strain USNM 41457) TaxID=1003232 RepID=J9DJX7_EDHAE|nr:hypothetical protein EDEG_03804 [Edhazardia aedis USNM 41457]|eukprot:EJW01652.1 hypothetical protein EDEG_03804 [Edhazardia aedis USNM 41457]
MRTILLVLSVYNVFSSYINSNDNDQLNFIKGMLSTTKNVKITSNPALNETKKIINELITEKKESEDSFKESVSNGKKCAKDEEKIIEMLEILIKYENDLGRIYKKLNEKIVETSKIANEKRILFDLSEKHLCQLELRSSDLKGELRNIKYFQSKKYLEHYENHIRFIQEQRYALKTYHNAMYECSIWLEIYISMNKIFDKVLKEYKIFLEIKSEMENKIRKLGIFEEPDMDSKYI